MKFEMSQKPLTIFSFSSLTDIVLLLLIFFLLTSQFVVQTGVKVKLPAAKNMEQSIPTKLVVSITEEGKIYLGSKPVDVASLPAELEGLKQQSTEDNLIIRADKSVNIETVIKVIDAARSVGLDKFTIETEKETY